MERLFEDLHNYRKKMRRASDWLKSNHPKVWDEMEEYLRSGKPQASPLNKKKTKPVAQKPKKTVTLEAAKQTATKANEIVGFYCDCFKEKYGTHPAISGSAAGNLKRLLKEFGLEGSKKLIQAYFEMRDQWFLTRSHDVGTLVQNLNKVKVFADRGVTLTKRQTVQLEQDEANARAVEAHFAGD